MEYCEHVKRLLRYCRTRDLRIVGSLPGEPLMVVCGECETYYEVYEINAEDDNEGMEEVP